MTIKFTSIPPKTLSQAILSSGLTFKLSNIKGWDGVNLTSAEFGTQAFGAFISADRTLVEFFSFDPSTITSTSISFVNRGLAFTGADTVVSGNKRDWTSGSTTVQLGADVPQLLTLLMALDGAQTVTGVKTFASGATPKVTDAPLTSTEVVNKAYADGLAIAGAPDSSTTVKGISKMSVAPASATSPIAVGDNDPRVPTQGENDAQVGNNIDVAVGTGNKFVTQTGLQHNAEKYAADAGANDTYVITLSPVPTSYTNGMVVHFKANTANTGAATLNVNSLGAKTIKKYVSTTLADGDIAAGMLCTVIYDGTDFILQNPIATLPQATTVFTNGVITRAFNGGAGAVTTAHGLGKAPKKIRITAEHGNGAVQSRSVGTYNGTTNSNVYRGENSNGQYYFLADSTNVITMYNTSFTSTTPVAAAATFDATNITLTWGADQGTGVFNIMWEAEA